MVIREVRIWNYKNRRVPHDLRLTTKFENKTGPPVFWTWREINIETELEMECSCSRTIKTSQPHRKGWKSLLIMVGFLISCAKEGTFKPPLLKMPPIPSHPREKDDRSACEVELSKVKESLNRCEDLLIDLKYENICWDTDYGYE